LPAAKQANGHYYGFLFDINRLKTKEEGKIRF